MKTGIRARWPEVRALFEAAIEQPRAQRVTYVSANAGDPLLRDAVLALLASEDGNTQPVGDTLVSAPPATDTQGELRAGEVVGNYRIERAIGRGGMGMVYLAEQLQPRRKVAIKLIVGQLDQQALGRFRREADLLARLSHPGIAQIIELTADAAGRPLLVMEYIDGRSLSEHAIGLPRVSRLQLLARIADAVDHAHGRGIVHRDLKPSNILVDTGGNPKILDFGIAFLSDAGTESLTATGMLLGTPAYMSPEQAQGRGDIDARADVYALGGIGFELLTDRLPLPVSGLTPLQALRMIAEHTPAPLGRIDASLRGDLETIIDKAMAKEPSLRYANAGAFADDLRRYLHQEPIHARRASRTRRAWLFARRNRLLVGLAAATAVSLIVGLVVSLWFAWAKAAESERAEAALTQSRATLTALQQVFSAGNPVVAGQPEVAFRSVLASASAQLAQVPDATRAEVLYALAEAQLNLGDDRAAAQRLEEVRTLALKLGNEPLFLRASLRRAGQMADRENAAQAEAFISELLARPGIENEPLIRASLLMHAALAAYYRGHWLSSRRAYLEGAALWPVPAAPADMMLRNELEAELLIKRAPILLASSGGAADVQALAVQMRSAHERLQEQMGAEHPRVVQLRFLADALPDQLANRSDWSARLLADLRSRIPELGPTHPAILARLQLVGWVPLTDGDVALALIGMIAQSIRALPADNRWRARNAVAIERYHFAAGRSPLSADEIADIARVPCAPEAPLALECMNLYAMLANMRLREGRAQEAIAVLQGMVGPAEQSGDPTLQFAVHSSLGRVYNRLDLADETLHATDAAMEALLRDPEIDVAMLDADVFNLAVIYRKSHCERLLEYVAPRESRLATYPNILPDVLARMLSTCEVRTGADPGPALARLDKVWKSLGDTEPASLVRFELVMAYLEIHDFLERDAEFAHWAGVLDGMVGQGLDLDDMSERFAFIKRARGLAAARAAQD